MLPKYVRIITAVAGWTDMTASETENDKPALRRFNMTAYTGSAMALAGWDAPVVVDLAGLQISAKARPILRDHNPALIVGHTDSVSVDDGQLHVAGTVSGAGAIAQEVIAAAENGFPWQASIGASVQNADFIPRGKQADANGRSFTGPVYIARTAALGEVSFVALGADDNTTATVTASQSHQENATMDFTTWLTAKGFDADSLTDAQTTTLQAMFDAEQADATGGDEPPTPQAPAHNDSTPVGDLRAELAAETERVAAIRATCSGQHNTIEAQAIKDGWDVTRTELEVLRAERPSTVNTVTGGHDVPTNAVLEAAACLASGISTPEQHFNEQTLDAADKRFRGQLGLQELLLEAAWAGGYNGRSFRGDMHGVLEAAFSNLSLPSIFSNIANKFLLAGFEGVEDTWRALASIRTVRDFKQVSSYRLNGGFTYEEVGPDGELKHGELGEESYHNQAKTYGKMFSLTRHDLINDDLGALTAVPRRLGRGAALKLNDVFWRTFLDDAAFFSAGNNNLLTGANTALSIDALTTAEQQFLDLEDSDGNPMAVSPAIMLVPNALLAPASQLMQATSVREDGNANKSKYLTNNPHAGKFQVVRSSYLGNGKIPGGSVSAWYLLANPADMPVIEVAFLNGQQRPIVERADADFNVLGIQMRGYHDFGVARQEPKGGLKNTGVAAS